MILIGGYCITTLIGQGNAGLTQIHDIYMEQFDQQVKQEVQTATAILNEYQQKATQGQLSEVEAQKQAAAIIRGLRYGKDGYIWADTTNGMNIVNLGKESEGKSRWEAKDANGVYYIQEIINSGSQDGGGYTQYDFPKPDDKSATPKAYSKRSYSLLFRPWSWVIGTGNYYDNIDQIIIKEKLMMQKATSQRIMIGLALAMLALIINLLIAWLINRKTQRDVKEMVGFANQLADGNFTIQNCTASGEMKSIGNSLCATVESLRTIIFNVKIIAKDTSDAAVQITMAAEQAGKTSEQVAIASNEVAAGASRQSDYTNSVLNILDLNGDEIERGLKEAQRTYENAKETSLFAQEGRNSLVKAIDQLSAVGRTVEFATDSVQKLGQRSDEIGKIVTMITSIASQTSLLALNASIEAARAGEAGRGFSVVAQEISKLSERTTIAAKSIAELIKDIQAETSVTVSTMESNLERVNLQLDNIKQGGKALEQIVERVKETEKDDGKIQEIFTHIQVSSLKINHSVKEISTIILDTVAQTQQVAASTEEQSAATQEMAASAEQLSEMAERLKREVERFITE